MVLLAAAVVVMVLVLLAANEGAVVPLWALLLLMLWRGVYAIMIFSFAFLAMLLGGSLFRFLLLPLFPNLG